MASMDFDASPVPADIVSALGLAVGTTYVLQNLSTVATLFLREASAMPSAAARAFRIEASGTIVVKPVTGAQVFLWTDNLVCPCIVSEAP